MKLARTKIFFINRFYRPDTSATSQILTQLAEGLVGSDYSVAIITSRLWYSENKDLLPSWEELDGVKVYRLWSTSFGRSNLVGRALDYLTFYVSVCCFLLFKVGKSCVVVAKTDPPLLSIPAAIIRQLKGYKLINWCQDLFPEVAMAGKSQGFVFSLMNLIKKIRNMSLNACDLVAVLSDDMYDYLAKEGIPLKKVVKLPNWAVQDFNNETEEESLREEWGLEGNFIVGYSGNLGRAHDWKTLIKAAESVKNPRIQFLVCGGGHGYTQLKSAVFKSQLQAKFHFLPYQDKEKLASSLKVPHVHWVSLRDEMSHLIFPSKVYGILASGRPILFIGKSGSELSLTLERNAIGKAFSIGDSDGLAKAINDFFGNERMLTDFGANAFRIHKHKLLPEVAIANWEQEIKRVVIESELS